MATLEAIFKAVEGRVNPQKLRQLRRYLGSAIGSGRLSQAVDDPMILRSQLVHQMRTEAVSAGTIEALVQFYMGIIRRVAIARMIPAPPEGPWTRAWQSVLDLVADAAGKAQVRLLAAWATDKGIAPSNVNDTHFKKWVEDLRLDECAETIAIEVLRRWEARPIAAALESDKARGERLKRKSLNGTVSLE